MCIGNNPPPAKAAPAADQKPVFIRNPYLDSKENAQGIASRTDRASLMIPLETGIGFTGRNGTGTGTDGGAPAGNIGFTKPRSAGSLTIGPSPKMDPRGSLPGPGPDLTPGPRGPRHGALRADLVPVYEQPPPGSTTTRPANPRLRK